MDAPAKISTTPGPAPSPQPGAPAPKPNPPNNPPAPGATVHSALPPGTSASSLAVKHGGNKGGRKREDGLVPGSPEALAADRKRDAERKKRERATVSEQRLPAPLPPVISPLDRPVQPGGDSLLAGAGIEDASFLPWSGEMVTPAIIQSVALLQELEKGYVEKKLAAANIPVTEWNKILDMAKWPDLAVRGITKSGGDATARLLNYLGISSKYKDVLNFCPSLIFFVLDRMKFYKRLDELVKVANPPAQPAKKP